MWPYVPITYVYIALMLSHKSHGNLQFNIVHNIIVMAIIQQAY